MLFEYFQIAFALVAACLIGNWLVKRTLINGFLLSIAGVLCIFLYRLFINALFPTRMGQLGYEVGCAFWPLLTLVFCEIMRRYYRAKVVAEHSLRRSQLRESDLRLQAEKQKSLVEMGQLAAGLNHEIGNAIDPIGYQIEDLSKEKIEHPAVQKALPLMRSRMSAVERLLDALRDVSRPIQLKPERINLPKFLNSVLLDAKDLPQSKGASSNDCGAGFQPAHGVQAGGPHHNNFQMSTKGVEFVTNVADPALACNADEPWLRRVLFNLLRNAAEACQGRPGPRVALEATLLDGFVKIEVKDNGKGMDDALLARLFEPFFSTKGGAGTGLGLFISRKVIELHGGRIEVSSKVGEGTTFAVLLPREAVKQEGLVEQGR